MARKNLNPFDTMLKIDSWLLDKVELVSHKIQRYTGYDCFYQAKWILGLYIMLRFLEMCMFAIQKNFMMLSLRFIGTLIFCLIQLYTIEFAKTLINVHFKNPLRNMIILTFIRCSSAAFAIHSFILMFLVDDLLQNGLNLSREILDVSFFYLVSCTPLPPCESKLKKFFTSLSLGKILPQGAT